MSDAGRAMYTLDAVAFAYDGIPAIHDVTLEIRGGTRVALLGANGSGKSTLLRILAGLEFPREGTVSFDGRPLTEAVLENDSSSVAFRRRVGLVFQNPDVQVFNATVFDEVAFGPLQMGWPHERVRETVARALESSGIGHLSRRPPHRLSMGEKKRVALASVLVLEPEVLLLDEPTAMLDPRTQGQIVDMLFGWSGSGRTVITATHDLASVGDIADRCVVMHEGGIVADGLPDEILGDEDLLRRTGLLHVHRHRHADGTVHAHEHVHKHEHGHEHGHPHK